jgi:two-component system NtrC family sensor kinase
VDAVAGRAQEAPRDVQQAIAEYLGIMDSEVERCKRIVNGLLDLSRPRGGEKRRIDVNAVVEQTLLLLKHHDRFKQLTLRRDLTADLPPVLGSPDQLIQVFMALMLNAADAMETRGTLTVRTGRGPVRDDEVYVGFSDTGHGIAKADLPKIFEPFYTTKPHGRGTGLGLSICYTIVADHRGRIDVDSTLGTGTTFTVILPITHP